MAYAWTNSVGKYDEAMSIFKAEMEATIPSDKWQPTGQILWREQESGISYMYLSLDVMSQKIRRD